MVGILEAQLEKLSPAIKKYTLTASRCLDFDELHTDKLDVTLTYFHFLADKINEKSMTKTRFCMHLM